MNSVNPVSKIRRLVPSLLDWFSITARDLPWRRTRDPYAIWVSEIMLQQTQVKTVIPFWERWMRELPTIESLADAQSEKILKLWEGLGYYTRVRNMQRAARQIIETHGGKFPEEFDDVLALPGIGRYTAGAICSIAFNQPTPILDGNVIRVLTRVFGIAENPREKETNAELWTIAEQLVALGREAFHRVPNLEKQWGRGGARRYRTGGGSSHLNQSLMELGALICTPRQPKCEVCPAAKFCVALKENRVGELPNLGKREKATARRFAAFVVERGRKFLVRQRPAGVVNAHLWEFPNVELNGETDLRAIANSAVGFLPDDVRPLCSIKHSITRYRMTLDAYRIAVSTSDPTAVSRSHFGESRQNSAARWLTITELRQLSFPSAHKKILAALADVD